jgi:Tol biopolymer transport system component
VLSLLQNRGAVFEKSPHSARALADAGLFSARWPQKPADRPASVADLRLPPAKLPRLPVPPRSTFRPHPPGELSSRFDRARWSGRAVAVVLGAAVVSVVPAVAGPSPQRTVRIRAAAKGQPNGASADAQISGDGRFVAFASTASNLGPEDPNGHVGDIYLYGADSSQILLLSAGPAGEGADGPSTKPSISTDGGVVAFSSLARNLLAETDAPASGAPVHGDVFAWTRGGGLRRVSLSSSQAPADGDSSEPDISGDGQLVAFSSTADNLTDAHPAGQRDVYVRDLQADKTVLVSATPDGAPGDGASSAPAISPDGRYVSFSTTATNLVSGMTLSGTNVVVRDLTSGTTALASVSSTRPTVIRGSQASAPMISDVSSGGGAVVFESQATNLVSRDTNHHTDVFVREMTANRTVRASLATTDQQGDGASFAPTISPDGRYVTFLSNAGNLTPAQHAGVNVFVRDLVRHTTVMGDVSSTGRPRGAEQSKLISQRASASDDGSSVVFISSARNLVADKKSRTADAFLRHLLPAPISIAVPAARLIGGHVVITFRSADRQAGGLLCRLDHRARAICPLSAVVLPLLAAGRHTLTAYAGGPGSEYSSLPTTVKIVVRKGGRANVTVKNPGAALGIG